jgi:hypothetical protein
MIEKRKVRHENNDATLQTLDLEVAGELVNRNGLERTHVHEFGQVVAAGNESVDHGCNFRFLQERKRGGGGIKKRHLKSFSCLTFSYQQRTSQALQSNFEARPPPAGGIQALLESQAPENNPGRSGIPGTRLNRRQRKGKERKGKERRGKERRGRKGKERSRWGRT